MVLKARSLTAQGSCTARETEKQGRGRVALARRGALPNTVDKAVMLQSINLL